MKVKTLSALAGLGGALIMTTSASASYQGLSVVSSLGAPQGRITYRVYANFSDAGDGVTVVYGNAASALTIESRNTDDTASGGNFFNPISSHGNAPTSTEVFGGVDINTNPVPAVANAAFDTFFTIGAPAGYHNPPGTVDGTGNQGMPANFLTGASFSTTNAGWFTEGLIPQGTAGFAGDGDPLLRVLILQLTVSSTSHVRGTVNIGGINNTGLAGGTSFDLSGQTFTSVPAPGALALLGLAGLVGSRRRRA